MKIHLHRVFESDIDLFIMNEFISDPRFAALFLKKFNIEDYEILEATHSASDTEYGESDILFILKDNNEKRYGIHIENKINAIAMPRQCERYSERGKKGILNNDYDEFHIFIIAPERYLNNNNEAKKYPNKISYEKLREYFINKNDIRFKFKEEIISQAIEKEKNGWIAEEDIPTTIFWRDYYIYQQKHYPELELIYENRARPKNQTWFYYRTKYKKIKLAHKASHGFIDLQFSGYGNKLKELSDVVKPLLDEDMKIVRANKSASIRIETSIIDSCEEGFDYYSDDINNHFQILTRLNKLLYNIDYSELYIN